MDFEVTLRYFTAIPAREKKFRCHIDVRWDGVSEDTPRSPVTAFSTRFPGYMALSIQGAAGGDAMAAARLLILNMMQ